MYVYKVIHLLRATNLISLITSALTVAFIDHEGEPQNRASQSGGRDIPRDPIKFDLYWQYDRFETCLTRTIHVHFSHLWVFNSDLRATAWKFWVHNLLSTSADKKQESIHLWSELYWS